MSQLPERAGAAADPPAEPSPQPARRHRHHERSRPRRRDARAGQRRRRLGELLAATAAFAAALGVVLVYALRGDGAFDLITRQEHGLVIWWLVAVGVALGLLPRRRPGRAALAMLVGLALFTAWTAVSLSWTESAERTTAELARGLDYLGLLVLAGTVLDRVSWRPAALGWIAGAIVVCGLAFASRLWPGSFPVDQVGRVFGRARLSYPFGYWNAVGAWASLTGTMAFAWSAHDRRRWPRALLLASVPLAAGTAYLTYSRASVAGFAAGAAVVLVAGRHRLTAVAHLLVAAAASGGVILAIRAAPQIADGTGVAGAGGVALAVLAAAAGCALAALVTGAVGLDRLRVPRRVGRPALALVAGAVIAAAAIAGPPLARHAWQDFRHPKVVQSANPAARLTSLSGYRYQLWQVAWSAFEAHPLRGTGAGTFEFWWNRHATETQFVQNAHSLWLEVAAELGLPGLVLIVAFALGAMWAAVAARRRSRRSSSVAAGMAALAGLVVFLVQASVDWMWQSTSVTVLALGAVAIVAVRTSEPRLGAAAGPGGSWQASRAARRRVIRLALVAVAALGAAVQVPGLLSAGELSASQAAARRGEPATALAWADDAVAAEPWAASPYVQRGLVEESFGRLPAAVRDLRVAVSHEPTDFDNWVILARVQAESGDVVAAARDASRARALRPLSPVVG